MLGSSDAGGGPVDKPRVLRSLHFPCSWECIWHMGTLRLSFYPCGCFHSADVLSSTTTTTIPRAGCCAIFRGIIIAGGRGGVLERLGCIRVVRVS